VNCLMLLSNFLLFCYPYILLCLMFSIVVSKSSDNRIYRCVRHRIGNRGTLLPLLEKWGGQSSLVASYSTASETAETKASTISTNMTKTVCMSKTAYTCFIVTLSCSAQVPMNEAKYH